MATSRREKYAAELAVLKKDRDVLDPVFSDIANNMRPYSDPLIVEQGHRSIARLGTDIIDPKPIEALRVLCAGLMSGVTSPVRNWYKFLVNGDEDLSEHKSVKLYLEACEKIIGIYLRLSNWYDMLSNSLYPDFGSFATSPTFIERDPDVGLWFTPVPMGEYYLDTNH